MHFFRDNKNLFKELLIFFLLLIFLIFAYSFSETWESELFQGWPNKALFRFFLLYATVFTIASFFDLSIVKLRSYMFAMAVLMMIVVSLYSRPSDNFVFFTKWISLYFIINFASLTLNSFLKKHNTNSSSGLFGSETLPLVYIGFAIFYLSYGAHQIGIIADFSFVFSGMLEHSIRLEKSTLIWDQFQTYQYRLPHVLVLIFMTLIINCSRSYYHIHELDHGKGLNDKEAAKWGLMVDWIIRIVIACIFIFVEHKIYSISMLNPLSNYPEILDALRNFSIYTLVLYGFILIWALFARFKKLRNLDFVQACIFIGGIIFSILLLNVSNGKKLTANDMFCHMLLFSFLALPLLVVIGAIFSDFFEIKKSRNG